MLAATNGKYIARSLGSVPTWGSKARVQARPPRIASGSRLAGMNITMLGGIGVSVANHRTGR
ncbi:MAG: hypothetical protein JRI25_05995 [Deltaproteobacteria bacterium]|nr:hypothetical protein [Deltaproteobacteria bacterium]